MNEILNKKNLNKYLFFFLLLWIILVNFHFSFSKYISFYKEFFFIFFLIISCWYIFNFKHKLYNLIIKSEICIFFIPYLFFLLIIILNPGSLDPEYLKSSDMLGSDRSNYFLIAYVVRNFIIFLPIFLYLSLRGLTENEIRKMLLVFFYTGFLGYLFKDLYNIFISDYSLYKYLTMYNYYSYNNTYAPYLTGIYFIGFYLGLKETRFFYLYLICLILSLILFIIFLGAGKSTILFSLFCLLFFFLVNLKNAKFYKIILVKFLLLFLIHVAMNEFHKYHINNLELDPINKNLKTGNFVYPIFNNNSLRLNLGSRLEIYKDFFNYLDSLNDKKVFFFGQGSLSSIFSGYHNDYFRIFYRTGFFGLILSFFPILYFFFKYLFLSYKNFFYKDKKDLHYLFFLFSAFTPYYSLFQYPREDTFQSAIFWFGFALIYGLNKTDLKK
jgi:hypothetical protein